MLEPQDHLRITKEHLKYQRNLLASMAEDFCDGEHSLLEYVTELEGMVKLLSSFEVVIKYYEKNQ